MIRTIELEGRIIISPGQFTISNLQLSDAGYWVFLRSDENLDFELVTSGSFVELWPENQRLITYWKTSAFDQEEAVCKGNTFITFDLVMSKMQEIGAIIAKIPDYTELTVVFIVVLLYN